MQEMLEAIGLLLSNDVQYGQMPDSPDNVLLLNFYGGNSPKRSLGNKQPTVREPSIQLRVRNKSYFNAIAEIERCIVILNDVSGEYANIKITKASQIGDVIPLGRDEKNRYEFSINFMLQIDNEKKEE